MKNVKKLVLLFVLLFVSVFFVVACAQSSGSESDNKSEGDASSSDPVKIGVVVPLTGPAALYGQQVQEGSEVAAQMINEQGGILGGRKIELLFEDDQSQPEQGVSMYSKLIDRDKVHAVTGGTNSSVSVATAEVAKDKILNIVTISKAPEIMDNRDPYRFRLNSTNDMDGQIFHKFIAEELKPETVAVIVENTDYGQAELEALKKNWSGEGSPKIVATEFFELTETDFTNPLTKLKSANADALYVVGAAIEINSAIFKQAHQLGFEDTMKLLAPGNINAQVVELAGAEAAEGIISAVLYSSALDNELNQTFVEEFEKKYNYRPEKMQVLGFESIWFTAKAMDEAGTVDNYDEISTVLEENQWESPRGIVDFVDGQALGDVTPLTVKDGEIVLYK